MAVFKCKMCGGTIEFEPGASIGVCDSCGTKQTLPKIDSERRAQMYDRANHFRRNNEYDKAMGVYEDLLNDDPTDAEAYWSLVLCRYGIEYVEDPATRRQVPTVNRAQYTSIYADEDYKSAIAHADGYQREIYEQEAAAIDEIQKGILEISSREEPFDVFICYKETDNNGRRTQDSVLANELYHELTQEGFKVFFARITLEDKLGSAYEPYIFAALHSAKVMVVLGTKPEYFNAVWVRNEWSRFLALVKQSDGKKTLIPAYRNMDAYDLPEEFSNLQAQDMSKLGFMQDLIRGIRKIIGSGSERARAPQATVVVGAQGTVAPLLERVSMFLEDGAWADADTYCEKVLDLDPKNGRAYLGKLLAELKVASMEQLQGVSYREYEHKPSYEKAIRFDAGIAKQFAELREKALSARYDLATEREERATSAYDYEGAAAMFAALGDYRDSQARAENCNEQAKELERSEAYDRAARREAAANSVKNFRDAASLFAALGDYRDSQERAKNCNEQAHMKECDATYGEAQNRMKQAKRAYDYLFAAQLFSRIRDWRDAKELEERCRKSAAKCQRKKNRLIFIVVTASILLLTAIIAVSASSYAARTPEGYLSYRETDGGVVITGVNADRSEYVPKELVIPATLKGKSVTRIGSSAFSDCTSLTSITIPEGVTSIGDDAFSGCTNIDTAIIPAGAIGAIPKESLKTVIINGGTGIGDYAFRSCTSLTSITIPASVTSIGSSAFNGCTSLTSIAIPSSVTSIGTSAFKNCTSLMSITIPSSVTSIGSSAFRGCTGLTSIAIPSSVTSIGTSAFKNCTSLMSITIPSSVTSIGADAFYGCTSLTSIAIPEGVTSIGDDAFSGCTSLTNITIPSSVTSIGWGAFRGCTGLTSITIPSSVTSIGSSAFEDCTSLTSITISRGVTSIGSSAFSGCTSLSSITYTGTKAQWNDIEKGFYWSSNTGNFVVHCTDGGIVKRNA